MSRLLLSLLEALGLAFCEKGRKALQGYQAFGDCLSAVAEHTLKELRKHMPADQIRVALAEAAAFPAKDYEALVEQMMKGLCRVQSVPFREELKEYLLYFPLTIRQMFHRPSDREGLTAPERLDFYKAEQLLPFMPARRPNFKPHARPDGLDHWELRDLIGLGECGEVWAGYDEEQPSHSPAALKFAIEKESKKRIRSSEGLFHSVFDLNEIPGIVPLRSVFLESDPPCLEYAFVSGYDLTGLMHEWRWKFDHAKPEASLKLVRRIAEVVGKAHKKGVVHRDLKPSNVLIHPTDGGKFTLWITDYGWGQIESTRSVELHRMGGTPAPEQKRLALRGAYTPLYASPQQTKNESPTPSDDVHALGVIWYQLLKRDPHASAPVGEDWAEEFYPHGFSKNLMKILTACVAVRPDRRPADANVLLELIDDELATVPLGGSVADGSKIISLKSLSSTTHTPLAVASLPAVVVTAPPINAVYHPIAAKNSTTSQARIIRNSLGISFVPIPAGTFEMGATEDEKGHRRDETPRHTVRISRSFHMGIVPVTQSQYEKLMGRNPSFFHQRNGGAPDFPVESISWYEAERFCQKLSRFGDEEVYGRIYRLPTEAEWEYACRAGSTSAFSFDDEISEKHAHFASTTLKTQGKPCPVGIHPSNAFGLQDMHGNIEEWISDWYGADFYIDSPGTDPHGPNTGQEKVTRGGDWACQAVECRSAARRHQHPDRPLNTLGFRIVMITSGR